MSYENKECRSTILAAYLFELLFDLKMDTLLSPETSVNFYQTTGHRIMEDSTVIRHLFLYKQL
jgi:hypothetical protein